LLYCVTANAKDASTAAEVREAFFQFCAGSVPKKEVGLRMSRKGFAEDTANFWAGVKKTSRRVYRFNFPDRGVAFAVLHRGCAPAAVEAFWLPAR
jgi:hypothetical protein